MTSANAQEIFITDAPGAAQSLVLVPIYKRNVRVLALLVIVVGWLPLGVLAAITTVVTGDTAFFGFLTDYGVHARSLIAAPCLVIAEVFTWNKLGVVAAQFRDKGVVQQRDFPAYDEAIAKILRFHRSRTRKIAPFVIGALVIAALWSFIPLRAFPAWTHTVAEGASVYTLAGWWHAFVSAPLLLLLLLAWAFRLLLWSQFLYAVSRLRLRIIPSHPDGGGGLKFIGISLQGFSLVAFALGCMFAGRISNLVLHDGMPIADLRSVILSFLVFILLLFAGPLLVFVMPMYQARRSGLLHYGVLSRMMGKEFERVWLANSKAVTAEALGRQDFSATTDLYSITSNVYRMSIFPASKMSFVPLIVSALIPLVPVTLASIPKEVVLQQLARFFL